MPFFWSQHYDVGINYVGHAEGWDRVELDGSPADTDCAVRFFAGDELVALATIYPRRREPGQPSGFEHGGKAA